MKRRSRQLGMTFRTHGGKRKGAGRKRTLPGKRRVSHRARPTLKARFPVHVTTRIRDDVPRLRNRRMCALLRSALLAVSNEPGFRICEFSIQREHIHLVCEARSNAALARGIKRFKLRVARAINRRYGRKGSVFADRYHMEILTTPRQTRNALCYVLQNARRHGAYIPTYANGVDPYSSAWWFDGWKSNGWRRGLSPPEGGRACVSGPRTWMLRAGWRRHGLIGVDEVPPEANRRAAGSV